MSKYKTKEYRERHAAYVKAERDMHPGRVYERNKRYRERNPEKYRLIQANSSLKKHYGITLKQRDEILASQGNCCAICKTSDPGQRAWHVDHCHNTGAVRGILCNLCNMMLGSAKDNRETLAAAIKYLEREDD